MMRTRLILSIIFIAALSLTFVFGFAGQQRTLNLPRIESTLVPSKVAVPYPLSLSLDSPSVLRLGDVGIIRLRVTMDAQSGGTLTAVDTAAMPDEELIDAFDLYDVIAETKLYLPRMNVTSSESVSQPIRAGQTVTVTWTVSADAVGQYEGIAWLFLRFVPADEDGSVMQASGPGSELAVAAIPFQLRVVSLVGMTGSAARIAGTVGLFASILIALPLFLDHFYRPISESRRGAKGDQKKGD